MEPVILRIPEHEVEFTVAALERCFTVAALARCFANLSDEQQADFFEEVAKVAEAEWDNGIGNQFWFAGNHAGECHCVTERGQEIIKDLFHGMEHGLTKRKCDARRT